LRIVEENICIEYDGRHHFEPVKAFGGETTHIETKKNDQIKTNFCNKNGIKLIRVPYFKEKEKINFIKKYLKMNNDIK
jgi:very-short-patch-repair endonuclease